MPFSIKMRNINPAAEASLRERVRRHRQKTALRAGGERERDEYLFYVVL